MQSKAHHSVNFVSLGCPKNLVDSQVMLGMLQKDQYQITREPEKADVIIVNTCSFIEASKEESIETILEMADYKVNGKCKVLVASGCLPQRYAKQLETEMPEVDLFIGTGQYQRVVELLNSRQQALQVGAPLPQRSYIDQPAFIHTENDPRLQTGPTYTAYLKLSEGCNRRCAFCIIPTLRGNVRSRTVASLVQEAKQLAAQGAKELNLVAQDLTEYGMEWKYKENLEMLLPELCKIEGIEWIRLHYVYPDEFSEELIEIIAREPKIVKYLDMPIQHTNDRVLKQMNRRLTKAKLFALVEKLRERIPGIVFRTSIIVGFPSETDADFEELCRDLEQLRLDHVGVFRYSIEEGTKAAEMSEQVSAADKRKRAKILVGILQSHRLDRQESLLGFVGPALIEGVSDESELLLKARLSTQAQEVDGYILINDLGPLELSSGASGSLIGAMVQIEVIESSPDALIARVVGLHRQTAGFGLRTELKNSALAKVQTQNGNGKTRK